MDAPEIKRIGAWTVHSFDVIDSTNQYLLDEAAGGAAERLVAVAGHQSAGRGRRGRVWDSKPGASLLLSIFFRPPADTVLSRYPQAVGLAVVDACKLVGGFDASLKWPNDVVASGRKLAGILAEASTGPESVLIVGSGINLNWEGELPEALADTAISADEAAGHRIEPDAMLDAILAALDSRLSRPDWIAASYKVRCSTLGREVRIERETDPLTGTAVDLTNDGALVVEDNTGERHTVLVGDAVHVRSANQ